MVISAGGCVIKKDRQFEVDYTVRRVRIYIYEKPTYQIAWQLRDLCAAQNGGNRERTGRCMLTFLRKEIDLNDSGVIGEVSERAAETEWNMFTRGGEWDDIMSATDDVRRAGAGTDSRGDKYARRCLVGDRHAFRAPNWTFRVGGDSHCKRGSYATR
ncbi:hypothetical protein [Nonomuraea sp. LPB2021202275-12-8]|uniref:hypothetical protein n=1 Tax=Nonomuraea sp. LPB2021202275-12-8 TaxID=3120159 RepID=UPI00300C71BB